MSKLILVLNEELPRDLTRALEKEAKAENVTVNDVAVAIIAEEYDLEWQPSGNPYRPLATRCKIRVPEEMRRVLAVNSAEWGYPMRGLILQLLSQHFGTRPIDPKRRPRKELV